MTIRKRPFDINWLRERSSGERQISWPLGSGFNHKSPERNSEVARREEAHQ